MKKIVALALLCLAGFSTNAASFTERQTGELTGYVPYAMNGEKLMFFKLVNNVSGGCNSSARFAVSESNPGYDAIIAAIMSAYHSKTTVTVRYTETCNAFSNSYDLYAFCVGDINC